MEVAVNKLKYQGKVAHLIDSVIALNILIITVISAEKPYMRSSLNQVFLCYAE